MKRDHHTGRARWAPLAGLGHRWRNRPKAEPAPRTSPGGILAVTRSAALILAALIVIAASVAAFAESYRGLWLWALHHGLAGFWADVFPLQIDSFPAVGELALFVALADQWHPRARVLPWLVTLGGLAVSVAGNVGHVTTTDLATKATAAVPPVAAATALAVGLGILKRVITAHSGTADTAPGAMGGPILPEVPTDTEAAALIALRASTWAGNPLSGRQLEARFGLTRQQSTRVRQLADTEANGHHPTDPHTLLPVTPS